ncbi:PREDICTED: NKG2D ligand 1-like [Chinchilla lanigera]|uniref:NKG2D ligand 1-like n=1 Tax=Chinchilla lanigera TaxID=34839 RepID=UPI000696E476|nr:PREDICTED: NKG2D ligand 1-like [Chinchilla lanigera]
MAPLNTPLPCPQRTHGAGSTPEFVLHVLARLLLLWEALWAACNGTLSLCYEFIIYPKTPIRKQWCTIPGLLDQKNFLYYDCDSAKAKSTDVLGGKVNSTKTWEDKSETLQDLSNTFKWELLDLKLENCTSTAALLLPS